MWGKMGTLRASVIVDITKMDMLTVICYQLTQIMIHSLRSIKAGLRAEKELIVIKLLEEV